MKTFQGFLQNAAARKTSGIVALLLMGVFSLQADEIHDAAASGDVARVKAMIMNDFCPISY